MDEREDASVMGEAGDGDPDVIVYPEHLLLVARQLPRRPLLSLLHQSSITRGRRCATREGERHLEGEEDGVRLGSETDGGGSLLDGLERILDLRKLEISGRSSSRLGDHEGRT